MCMDAKVGDTPLPPTPAPKPIPAGSCKFENLTDYSGGDINSVPADTPQECCTLCSHYKSCKFFTWAKFQKWCYMKDSITNRLTGQGDKVSGAVGGSSFMVEEAPAPKPSSKLFASA